MKEMKHNENQNQRRNIDFKKRISMTDLYSKEEIEKWIPIELEKKTKVRSVVPTSTLKMYVPIQGNSAIGYRYVKKVSMRRIYNV